MTSEEKYQYPNFPPDDQNLKYDPNIAIHRLNPRGIEQRAKFCPICDFPINIVIVSSPCNHYCCYSCFAVDTFQCRLCDQIIKEYKKLDDDQSFYNCDFESCFKYFENQEKFDQHMKFHNQTEK